MSKQAKDESPPTLEAVAALNGKFLAMLSANEVDVLRFYQERGRKLDVSILIASDADRVAMAGAKTREDAESLMAKSNCWIEVRVGANATAAWTAMVSAMHVGEGQQLM